MSRQPETCLCDTRSYTTAQPIIYIHNYNKSTCNIFRHTYGIYENDGDNMIETTLWNHLAKE